MGNLQASRSVYNCGMSIRIAVIAALSALVLTGCSGGGIKSGDIEASQSNERWERGCGYRERCARAR